MTPEHHAAIVRAAGDVAHAWVERKKHNWGQAAHFLTGPLLKHICHWVAETDQLEDLVIDQQFDSNVMSAIGHPTCFQHFAYSGSLADLVDGDKHTRCGDGYCWDNDLHMPWYAELANASTANVRYNPRAGFLPESILRESPGAKLIKGDQDWDNQPYPSAWRLIEFYEGVATDLQHTAAGHATRALCCALHLHQDLCVPHHVSNTIGCDHVGWEQHAEAYWKRIYDTRSPAAKAARMEQLQDAVWYSDDRLTLGLQPCTKGAAWRVSIMAIRATLFVVKGYLEAGSVEEGKQ